MALLMGPNIFKKGPQIIHFETYTLRFRSELFLINPTPPYMALSMIHILKKDPVFGCLFFETYALRFRSVLFLINPPSPDMALLMGPNIFKKDPVLGFFWGSWLSYDYLAKTPQTHGALRLCMTKWPGSDNGRIASAAQD